MSIMNYVWRALSWYDGDSIFEGAIKQDRTSKTVYKTENQCEPCWGETDTINSDDECSVASALFERRKKHEEQREYYRSPV